MSIAVNANHQSLNALPVMPPLSWILRSRLAIWNALLQSMATQPLANASRAQIKIVIYVRRLSASNVLMDTIPLVIAIASFVMMIIVLFVTNMGVVQAVNQDILWMPALDIAADLT